MEQEKNKQEKFDHDEFFNKCKPTIMSALDREGLDKYDRAEDRIDEYVKRIEELNNNKFFRDYMMSKIVQVELLNIIEDRKIELREIFYSIARKLKQENINYDIIARVTSITIEEVKKI